MYSVYIIYNLAANKFYIGQALDLEQKLVEHNSYSFKNSYTTRFAGEWKLVYKECCPSREGALVREKQLKSFQGRRFIKSKILQK